MRPSIMLLLRALLIMGSILAVMSCTNPLYAAATVEVRTNPTFGVIPFALNAGSYSCRFVPVAGGTLTDSTGTCHRAVTTHSRREV